MARLIHLSDPHIPPLPRPALAGLRLKRVLGWLSWHRRRKALHREAVLAALRADLARLAPDHIAVTGDLTNLGLSREFAVAAAWLAALQRDSGGAAVTALPGNHDAHIPRSCRAGGAETLARWRPWLGAATEGAADSPRLAAPSAEPGFAAWYPRLAWWRGAALIGLCTACPTAPVLATGRLGYAQIARLEALLARLGAAGTPRLLFIHHPPQPGAVGRRKALSDAPALRAALARAGAELICHGHAHSPRRAEIPGPDGQPIPVLGAGSASLSGGRGHAAGHYQRLDWEAPGTLACTPHIHDPARGRFAPGPAVTLAIPGLPAPAADPPDDAAGR